MIDERQIRQKAVAYYRISTRDKQEVGMQEKAVRDYCTRENIQLIQEYADIGQSGKKESRPVFDVMLNEMRNGNINTIIVYKLDRIGRSLSHLIKLFEEFEKKNINFISVTQNINTSTPEGKMFRNILLVLAQYERELIVNRINAGLLNAKEQGKKLGRPKGAKDKKRRIVSGYHLLWNSRKNKQSTPHNYSQSPQENTPKTENKQSDDYLQ